MTDWRWEMKYSNDQDKWAELLAEGWEPFAAFHNVGYYTVWFRRRVNDHNQETRWPA